MTAPADGAIPRLPTDVPTSARMYDYCLGGKDNFEIDRAALLTALQRFPAAVDEARNNRLFLYRVVRFLARDAGIRQFLDLGSGLPTQNNVHQVAQQFQPDATVVYVDNDPIVLAHGRALLAKDDSTTVISADMTRPEQLLSDPEAVRLLDPTQPVAVLMLSVAHWIVDDATVHRVLAALRGAVPPGSYLAFSQMVGVDQAAADAANEKAQALGMEAKNRIAADVAAFLDGLEPVEPGLVDVRAWRPDPGQPELSPVDEPLRRFVGASADEQRFMEFGGVLRRP